MIFINYLLYIKYIGIYFLAIIVTSFILAAGSSLNILSLKIIEILTILVPAVMLLILGFKIGKRTRKKGFIEGILYGIIILILTFLLSILFDNTMEIKNVLYYLIIIASSMLGSMFGKTKQVLKK